MTKAVQVTFARLFSQRRRELKKKKKKVNFWNRPVWGVSEVFLVGREGVKEGKGRERKGTYCLFFCFFFCFLLDNTTVDGQRANSDDTRLLTIR